uniref:Vacuolar protein-sorting-associated protein 25 n=1 Tax=Anas platyrhynchos platyrhynchos TaxID=8840 RepID=A0A493TY52_ANAPP
PPSQGSCRSSPSRWCWRSSAKTVGVRLSIGVGSVLYRGGSAPDCCPSPVPCLEAFLLLIPGNLEWLDKNKTSFLIMWRRPEEWGKLIYQWVSKNGLTNSVFTLYELVSGDDTAEEGNAMSRVPQQLFRARLIQIPKQMIS